MSYLTYFYVQYHNIHLTLTSGLKMKSASMIFKLVCKPEETLNGSNFEIHVVLYIYYMLYIQDPNVAAVVSVHINGSTNVH